MAEKVTAFTSHGKVIGHRETNGVQKFINVPYALPVARFTNCRPLDKTHQYDRTDFTQYRIFPAQPSFISRKKKVSSDLTPQGGEASECPFVCDIFVPPHVNLEEDKDAIKKVPVNVFIFGGAFHMGATSSNASKRQEFRCKILNEVRVLLNFRLSIFGFLASERHNLPGNYGLCDIWAGLNWVKENIDSFGGDTDNITLSGCSSGGQGVHYMLFRAAKQAPKKAPFNRAYLNSGALMGEITRTDELFDLVCTTLGLDPCKRESLDMLSDPKLYPPDKLSSVINDLGGLGARPPVCSDETLKDFDNFQQSGSLGTCLRLAGVKSVILSETGREDIYFQGFYGNNPDVETILARQRNMIPENKLNKLHQFHNVRERIKRGASARQICSDVLADGMVYIPIRMLSHGLQKARLPCLVYRSDFVIQHLKNSGITEPQHAADLKLINLMYNDLTEEEKIIGLRLNQYVMAIRDIMEAGSFQRGPKEIIFLDKDGTLSWHIDDRYDITMQKAEFLAIDNNNNHNLSKI